MNNLPKVAIICANYNYSDYIVAAMESIVNQTYKGELRLYVVDDGSTDDSWEKIRNFNNNKFLNHDKIEVEILNIENSGASVARNVAIRLCWDWADIIGVLDADDGYHPTKVEKLVAKLVAHDEVGVAYADYENVFPHYTKREFKKAYDKQLLNHECIVHSNSLIKKKYLEMVELPNGEFYNSKLHGPASQPFIGCTEDYDLWLRLSNVCLMTHVPESLGYANQHGRNQSMKMTQEIFNENAKVIRGR
jgi:glycosyltransferase involved in cell wall biosynthesis|tara:strand:- start:1025 stop:1768 length:744 start_codon:yes stop_codon:yes gene_type:complete